jgi:hypothetical protein
MARTSKKTASPEIEVMTLRQEEASFCILGLTPFYCNRVAEKARRELLMPRGRMTAAQKAGNLKHDPVAEFRSSPYLRKDNGGPTRILMLATAFKGAIGQAAIDMPTSVARAQIDRLTYVVGQYVDIWGIPQLDMAIVRSADIGHTPDVRTRAVLQRWASRVTLKFTVPMLNMQSVSTLLAASGLICGIGDFRQQKGKGNNGLFEIVPETNKEYREIIATGGLAAQDAALAEPECANPETEELLSWWEDEVKRRGATPEPEESEDEDEAQQAAAE